MFKIKFLKATFLLLLSFVSLGAELGQSLSHVDSYNQKFALSLPHSFD